MAEGPPNGLIEPTELETLLNCEDLVIIDTRDESVYHRGHIPRAISLEDIFYYLCLPENGGLAGMRAFFTEQFSEAGIRSTDRIVVYEDALDNGYGKSCRGWMLLQYMGHANVQVLHGGYRGWVANGLPVSQTPVKRQPCEFLPIVTPGHIIGQEEMVAALHDPDTILIDCRDYAEWLGANSSPYGYDYCPRKGRIPRSIWLEWYRLMAHRKGVAWFRSPEEIRAVCNQAGIPDGKNIVVYCFKGARASAVVMALRRAGYPSVVNYLPSWNEWSRDFTLPVDDDYPDETEFKLI
jgi:thiosulfate/3-mercaptopyruvate sulfurtransferase